MNGKQLFEMYVACGLCTGSVYKWDDLLDSWKAKWERMAGLINSGNIEYPWGV